MSSNRLGDKTVISCHWHRAKVHQVIHWHLGVIVLIILQTGMKGTQTSECRIL